MSIPEIVILGAGYGGMMTAVHLQEELQYNEAKVTLVNKHAYHYLTTLLHEPAAGTATSEEVQINIRDVIDDDKIAFRQGTVQRIDAAEQRVQLEDGYIRYDYLVIALGSEPETFGIEGLREHAFSISSLDSVRTIREHIEDQFVQFNDTHDRAHVTFIVGGAGFTGVEFVGELADRIPQLCKRYAVPQEHVRLICVEAAPTVLPGFDPELITYASNILTQKGVEFQIDVPIARCTPAGITLKNGEQIAAKTVVWTGGVRGNAIIEHSGFATQRGRLPVDPYLRTSESERVYAIGDVAVMMNERTKRPYPPTAQMATQQAPVCAQNILATIRDSELQPFIPHLKGTLASLGKGEGIGMIGKHKLVGAPAAWMKKVSDLRYLYMLGGPALVLKKGNIFRKV